MDSDPKPNAGEPKPEGGTPTPPTKIEVTVGGQTKEITFEEAKKAYEKVAGADEKFREASQLRKAGEQGVKVMELFNVVKSGTATPDQMTEYCDMFEIPEEERAALLYGDDGGGGSDGGGGTPEVKGEPKPVKLEDMDPAVQTTLRKSEESQRRQAREDFEKLTDNIVDKSEELVTLTKELDSKGTKALKQDVVGRVRNEVIVRLQEGQKYGPELVKTVTEQVVSQTKNIGNLFSQPDTPTPGFGVGGQSLSTAFQDEKPPERPAGRGDSTDDYANYFVKKLAQKFAKGQKG